jgi:hypothetical protein
MVNERGISGTQSHKQGTKQIHETRTKNIYFPFRALKPKVYNFNKKAKF